MPLSISASKNLNFGALQKKAVGYGVVTCIPVLEMKIVFFGL